uniref:Uncharacterized protein n=1 Tax=Oryza sativa subsp. japonica TaxID=39947 RepID=Q6Z3A9_ORYSJ|nr:hypothetical protein [Oryza sativa Japonica Group]
MIPIWEDEGALLLGVRRAGFWLGPLGVVAASRSVTVAGGAGEVSRVRGLDTGRRKKHSCSE